jgi:hypothetical protein
MSNDEEFTQTLEAMRTMWIDSSGTSHAHFAALLDGRLRRDASTRNYLASGASGTLRDRIFHPMNGDRITEAESTSINERYQRLLDEATRLSVQMNLPATADWT